MEDTEKNEVGFFSATQNIKTAFFPPLSESCCRLTLGRFRKISLRKKQHVNITELKCLGSIYDQAYCRVRQEEHPLSILRFYASGHRKSCCPFQVFNLGNNRFHYLLNKTVRHCFCLCNYLDLRPGKD